MQEWENNEYIAGKLSKDYVFQYIMFLDLLTYLFVEDGVSSICK